MKYILFEMYYRAMIVEGDRRPTSITDFILIDEIGNGRKKDPSYWHIFQ